MIILFFLLVLLIIGSLIHDKAREFLRVEFKWILLVSGIGFSFINSILLILIIPQLAFLNPRLDSPLNIFFLMISFALSLTLIFISMVYKKIVTGNKSFYLIAIIYLIVVFILILIPGITITEAF